MPASKICAPHLPVDEVYKGRGKFRNHTRSPKVPIQHAFDDISLYGSSLPRDREFVNHV